MSSTLTQSIEVEIAQIELLLATYADLLARVEQQPPDVVELAALATVLHAFYNGVENCFVAVARQHDQLLPSEARWHRVLLKQMSSPMLQRPPVISQQLETQLTDYLAFRHYFRHGYAFTLDWERLKPLVQNLRQVFVAFRHELLTVLQSLS